MPFIQALDEASRDLRKSHEQILTVEHGGEVLAGQMGGSVLGAAALLRRVVVAEVAALQHSTALHVQPGQAVQVAPFAPPDLADLRGATDLIPPLERFDIKGDLSLISRKLLF